MAQLQHNGLMPNLVATLRASSILNQYFPGRPYNIQVVPPARYNQPAYLFCRFIIAAPEQTSPDFEQRLMAAMQELEEIENPHDVIIQFHLEDEI